MRILLDWFNTTAMISGLGILPTGTTDSLDKMGGFIAKTGRRQNPQVKTSMADPSSTLSPAAQEVYDAFICTPIEISDLKALSAALSTAVDQVVPEEPLHGGDWRWEIERDARQSSRRQLLAIAAELKAAQ